MGQRINPADIKREVLAIAASTAFAAGGAGQTMSGSPVDLEMVFPGTLSCKTVTLAETNTVTILAKWQVSNDNSNWYDAVTVTNTAPTALSTGTSGADAAVTKVIMAPDLYAWKYGRIQLYTGAGTTTTGSDLGSALYYYQEMYL